MQYVYINPEGVVRQSDVTDQRAAEIIGDRVLIGFDVVQRWFNDRNGQGTQLTYFQSEITGKVWSIHY